MENVSKAHLPDISRLPAFSCPLTTCFSHSLTVCFCNPPALSAFHSLPLCVPVCKTRHSLPCLSYPIFPSTHFLQVFIFISLSLLSSDFLRTIVSFLLQEGVSTPIRKKSLYPCGDTQSVFMHLCVFSLPVSITLLAPSALTCVLPEVRDLSQHLYSMRHI